MKSSDNERDGLIEKIRQIYTKAGFGVTQSKQEAVLHFSNQFSHQFVILMDSYDDLISKWQEEHRQVVHAYQEYEGPRDMEWNFYAIFVVCDSSVLEDSFSSVRHQIESDTSFSRKFVISASQISSLPPSMITQDDLGTGSKIQTDLIDKWERVLGEELFHQISDGPKSAIENRVREYVGTKKHS